MVTYLRKATPTDLADIMEIISNARELLREKKVPQWQNNSGPSKEQLIQDIALKQCFVLVVDEKIAGLGIISTTKEETYDLLHSGQWALSKGEYVVIHRVALASEYQGKGLALTLMNFLLTAARLNEYLDIRIDTHPKNFAMQQLIKKVGFQYQGDVLLPVPNGERFAYQLVLK